MIRSIGLAAADLGTWPILVIMLQAIGISLLIFAGMAALLAWLLAGTDPCTMLGLGACPIGIGGGVLGAIALTLLGTWLLFPAVAIAVLTTFTDRIAGAVEKRHYPQAASRARPIGIAGGIAMGLKSAGRLLLFNLIALPLYLVLLVTGAGPFVLFVVVNGFAFGHDLAELAAARHGDRTTRRAWLKRTRGQQRLIGVVVSILFLVPFANLLAPVLGVAAGIHLFNATFWRADSRKSAVAR